MHRMFLDLEIYLSRFFLLLNLSQLSNIFLVLSYYYQLMYIFSQFLILDERAHLLELLL